LAQEGSETAGSHLLDKSESAHPHRSVPNIQEPRYSNRLRALDAAEPLPIRILVVDDNDSIRGILRRLLQNEADFCVVGEALTGVEALTKAEELQPDVILIDVSLPDIDGLQVAERMRNVKTVSEILIVSDYCEGGSKHAFSSGARGYLLKSDVGRELVTAVRTVHRKERYLSLKER